MKRLVNFLRRSWGIYGSAIILCILGFLLTSRYIKPAPPDTVRMAAGQPGGAYDKAANAFADYLEKERIKLEIVETSGAVENLELLSRGEVDVAIVQGGIYGGAEGVVEGMASLFEEPLWMFHHNDFELSRFTNFGEMRISIGPDGSGTQALVRKLIGDSIIERERPEIFTMDGSEAADALIAGEIDVALFVSSPKGRDVDRLLRSPNVVASSFDRASALARRYVFLYEVDLPEGTIDLKANIPETDLSMVSSTANLVAHKDLHPAVTSLLLAAAKQNFGDGSYFSQSGKFPTPDYLEFPLSEAAENYYKHGPPFLQRYLPFWAASLIDRVKIMLLPLVFLLLPMFKVMPLLYQWRMRARVISVPSSSMPSTTEKPSVRPSTVFSSPWRGE